ncbi:MAG TPA: hypothetical protein VII51_11550 [Gaiellaceae bacterium]
MPSRKQKRREAKTKRHEYEFVYLDSEGHELEGAPDEAGASSSRTKSRVSSTNGSKPAGKKRSSRPPRARREPQPPSWQRAGKRALLLGAVVFALFTLGARHKGGYGTAALLALVYTALFVPFTYLIDRFAYKRYELRKERGGTGLPQRPKKR